MLSPFTTGDTLSYYAALEQAMLAQRIYNEGADKTLDLAAAAGGEIVPGPKNTTEPNWNTLPTAEPIWASWKQGGEYWCNVKGTYTTAQWASNVFGFIVTSGLGTSAQTFHGRWAAMATAVWAGLKPFVKDDNLPINLSGHSLGGAVVWDVAALAKQDYPARTVRVLTFGSPRPMKGDYTGTKPTVAFDHQIADDPVVKTPPNSLPLVDPYWKQQGDKYPMSKAGVPLRSTYNDGELFTATRPDNWNISNHSISTYIAALRAYYESVLEPHASTAAMLQASGNQSTGGPATGGGGSSPPASGGFNPGGANVAFLVTMQFGYRKWGWTEQHYWQGPDYGACEQDAKKLGELRRGFLQPRCALEAISIAPSDNQGRVSTIGVRDINNGPYGVGPGTAPQGGADTACTFAWRAVLARVYTLNRYYARNLTLRGVHNNLGCVNISNPVASLSLLASANMNALRAFLCFLSNGVCPGSTAFASGDLDKPPSNIRSQVAGPDVNVPFRPMPANGGGLLVRDAGSIPLGAWSFKVRDKGVGRSHPYYIEDVKVSDTRFLWIKPGKEALVKTNPKQGVLSLGQRIHLHGLGGGLTGSNGDTRVLEVGTAEPYVGYFRLSKKQPCPCYFEYIGDGTYWLLDSALQPYGFPRIERVMNHKTGKPKGGTRGRGKKKCKRC